MSDQKLDKAFDAVQFQRRQRDELSRLYSEDPEKFFAELKIVEQTQPLTKGRIREDQATESERRSA